MDGIWDTAAAPGLLDDWNRAHPVKIPFGWEGQLHECQQQFCTDLSLLVDHLTFVVICFDNCCVHCPIKWAKKLCTLQIISIHHLFCINKRLWPPSRSGHTLCIAGLSSLRGSPYNTAPFINKKLTSRSQV
ncbi:hypothetical protein EMCRGX_G017092 [Ephydatia muelleri]